MKSGFCLAAALVAAGGVAAAQNWDGPYVGIALGTGDGGFSLNDGSAWDAWDNDRPSWEASGLFGGFYAGFNVQNRSIIYGLEADYLFTSYSGSVTVAPGPLTLDAQIDDIMSVRGRLGVTFGDLLFFGSAGLAWASGEHAQQSAPADPRGAARFDTGGLTAGVGAEFPIGERLSARVEYRYFNFSDERLNMPLHSTRDLTFDPIHAIQAGVSFGF